MAIASIKRYEIIVSITMHDIQRKLPQECLLEYKEEFELFEKYTTKTSGAKQATKPISNFGLKV